MREPHLHLIFLVLVVTAGLLAAGCVQTAGNRAVPTAIPVTIATPQPTVTLIPTTAVVEPVVTVIRYVSPPRDLRDSTLLFALQAPSAWNVSTVRLTSGDTAEYRTAVGDGGAFSIVTYPITRSREQEFRDQYRKGMPAPDETAVTINAIRYDRYERSDGGNTTVVYLSRANSANERGYGNVLVFTVRDSDPFGREDFEKVVSSFRYFPIRSAGSYPGEDIPVFDPDGRPVTRSLSSRLFDSSDWSMAGGASEQESFSTESSSGSSGGGCNR